MIATGIFFMCIFSFLALVTSNLRNARLLQKPQVDASMLLADLVQTNRLVGGGTCRMGTLAICIRAIAGRG